MSIPPSVRAEFESWRRAVAVVRSITAVTNRRSATVFVDASLQGWGGVIVDNDTTALTIVGGAGCGSTARVAGGKGTPGQCLWVGLCLPITVERFLGCGAHRS